MILSVLYSTRGISREALLVSNLSLFRSKEGEEDKILILDRPILPPNMGNKLGNRAAHRRAYVLRPPP